MKDLEPDHFYYETQPIPLMDPAKPQVGTLIFRLRDGQHHFSMSRQAFEQLALEIREQLEQAPLPARGSTSN
jgi:hypothetical protein